MGAIELKSIQVTSCCPDKVNTGTILAFLDRLQATYPAVPQIHVILDQAGYHRSEATQAAAKERNIKYTTCLLTVLIPIPLSDYGKS